MLCIVILTPAGSVFTELGEIFKISPGDSGRSTERSSSSMLITPPRASFPFTQNANTVTFMDTSKGNPTTWYWSFGKKKASGVQKPSHTSTKSGT